MDTENLNLELITLKAEAYDILVLLDHTVQQLAILEQTKQQVEQLQQRLSEINIKITELYRLKNL